MSLEEMTRLLTAAIERTLAALPSYGMEHSCIHAAVMLVRVLQKCGFANAFQLTVGARILNPALRNHIDRVGIPQTEQAYHAMLIGENSMVILGRDAPFVPEGNWAGHLVVIVPNAFDTKHAFIDLTITQVNSDEDGVAVNPVCSSVNDAFLRAEKQFSLNVNDCRIIYDAMPNDHSYGDWDELMTRPGLEEATDEIVEQVNQDLREKSR